MNSRYQYLQDPQQRGRLALVRSSAAAAIVIAVLALAAFVPHDPNPGGMVGTEFSDAATSMIAPPPPSVPEHIREAPGVDPLYPHQYVGQPSVH